MVETQCSESRSEFDSVAELELVGHCSSALLQALSSRSCLLVETVTVSLV